MTGLKGKVSVARRSKVAFGFGLSGHDRRRAPEARPRRAAARIWLALGLAVLLAPGWMTAPAGAAEITERVAVDQTSGIAIFGYDPVGYFLDQKPVSGRSGLEWTWHNAVWRFASLANRDEFMRAPESFAPAYGGYDADAVTRGAASFPDPTVFAVVDERLFLFRSEEAMERFLATDGVEAADRAWPALAAGLRP